MVIDILIFLIKSYLLNRKITQSLTLAIIFLLIKVFAKFFE